MPQKVFRFPIEPRFRPPLLVYGVTPGRAAVTVDEEHLHIRFGPWSTRDIRMPIALHHR